MGKRQKKVVLDNIRTQLTSFAPSSSGETIEICLAFDRNFVHHAAVTLLSAIQALGPDDKLIVHVLHAGDIDTNDRDTLSVLSSSCTIKWHVIAAERFSKLPDNRDHVSLATYLRLFIPEVLGETSSRVIYLDCDTIITDQLTRLWNENLGTCPIAAAPDEGGLTQAKRLHFGESEFYFNAGILVFDLTNLDFPAYWDAVRKIIEDTSVTLELQDQDILNLVFKGNTHRLHLRWNANTRLYTVNDLEPAYGSAEAHEAAFAPGILHFTDKRKPWNDNCNHPLRQLYWDLRNQTPWRENNSDRMRRRVKDAFRNLFSKSRKAVNRVW